MPKKASQNVSKKSAKVRRWLRQLGGTALLMFAPSGMHLTHNLPRDRLQTETA